MHAAIRPNTLIACCITLILAAPIIAQPTENGKDPTMKDQFLNPPDAYRMLQIIHGNFHYPPVGDTIEAMAERLKENGYGGVVANVSFDDYLESEEHWATFLKALDVYREKGMTFWLYDEKGYPSGKAGGLTLRGHPEFECKGIIASRIEGEGTLRIELPRNERIDGPPLLVIAAPVVDGRYDLSRQVDLTDKVIDGAVAFETKGGPWGLMAFQVKRMYEGTHIEANYSDTLPYVDIMDRDAIARFIEVTHEAYRKRCSPEAWDAIAAIFTDEPSLMVAYLKEREGLLPVVPWSRHFRDYFRTRFDYDIVAELPKLFVDAGETTVYRRLDFWRAVAELVEENYYGQIQAWCRANGIDASGHGLIEESIYHHALFEGDHYRNLRRMDVPGIDMLSSNPTELARSRQIPVPKFVSSVTHMIGRWENQSETSSHVQRVRKLPCSYEQRLATINFQYVLGLTRITSYYRFDEFDDEQRVEFNNHIARLGYMLTQGRHIADIGVYYPIQSVWGELTPTGELTWKPPVGERVQRVNNHFGHVSQELLANQRDFDYLDDEAILEAEVRDGALHLQGEAFRCVVLPEAWVMPLETLQQLADLVEAGGGIVALGGLPEKGMNPEETEGVVALSKQLAASDRVIEIRDVPGVAEAVGKLVPADLFLRNPCRDLFYCHRKLDGKDIYFLANLAEETVQTYAVFRTQGKTAQRWEPRTGIIRDMTEVMSDDETLICPVMLDPLEGVFVVIE